MKSEKDVRGMLSAYEKIREIESREKEHSREATKKDWIIKSLKWVLGEEEI